MTDERKPLRERLQEGYKISSVHNDSARVSYRVGETLFGKTVVAIREAEEPGQYCMIPWIEIEYDNGDLTRYPLNSVSITLTPPEPEEG